MCKRAIALYCISLQDTWKAGLDTDLIVVIICTKCLLSKASMTDINSYASLSVFIQNFLDHVN